MVSRARKSAASAIPKSPTAALDEVFTGDNVWELWYIRNLVKNTDHRSPIAYALCSALESRGFFIEQKDPQASKFPFKKKIEPKGKNNPTPSHAYPANKDRFQEGADPKDWALINDFFTRKTTKFSPEDPYYSDPAINNLRRLSDVMGLDEPTKNCLIFFYMNKYFSSVLDDVSRNTELSKLGMLLARISDDAASEARVRQYMTAVHKNGMLFRFGMLHYIAQSDPFPRLDANLVNRLIAADISADDLVSLMAGTPVETYLDESDFAHLGRAFQDAAQILRHALEHRETGVCIMLSGIQGSGKTVGAAVLAKMVGAQLYSVGEDSHLRMAGFSTDGSHFDDDDFDDMPPGHEPEFPPEDAHGDEADALSRLRRADRMLANKSDAVILFDEAERLAVNTSDASKPADPKDKLAQNRALENNKRPIILIVNDKEKLHRSLRDRVIFTIEMPVLPTKARERIWRRIADKESVKLTDSKFRELARQYQVEPRVMRHALRAYKATNEVDVIETTLKASANLIHDSPLATQTGCVLKADFTPDFINVAVGRQALAALSRAIQNRAIRTVLLETRPGHGQNELLAYIAEEAGVNIHTYGCDEFVAPGPNAPPPEVRINTAFMNAQGAGALLVINQPQCLTLCDDMANIPDQAWANDIVRAFERAVVDHAGPLVVAHHPEIQLPNHLTSLFLDRVQLAPLNAKQANACYTSYFGLRRRPPRALANIEGLVVDDFIRARHRLTMMEQDGKVEAAQILTVLTEERDIRIALDQPQRFGFSQLTRQAANGNLNSAPDLVLRPAARTP